LHGLSHSLPSSSLYHETSNSSRNRYPPVTEEQKTALYTWFRTRTPPTGAVKIPKILADIEAAYGPKTWGAVGFCWGGKLVSLTSGPKTPFKATCQAHPGMIDAADAAKITVPTCMLASEDESVEEVKEWEEALKVEKLVEVFPDQVHGWMSARGDLEDEKVRGEYERGYKIFLEFFAKFL
jgi:dienelactone hydrolase